MKPSPDTSKEDTVVIQIVDANRARTRGFSLPDLFLLAPEKIDGTCARG
jgi:hypothetical protein